MNDALADIPGLTIDERIALFESHIKPFGIAKDRHKIDFGYKYDFPVNKYPHALTYCSDRLKLKRRQPSAKINEPVELAHRKTPSMFSTRPTEAYDGWMKPFGADEKPYPGPYKVDPPYHLYEMKRPSTAKPKKKVVKKKKKVAESSEQLSMS